MSITVYYATNRNETGTAKNPSFGPFFHAKGPTYLRFGSAEIDPPARPGGDYKLRAVHLAEERLPDGARGIGRSRAVLGSKQIFENLRESMKSQEADLAILIHGYAADFETALLRGAQIKEEYATADRPLEVAVFSWPADGVMVPKISYHQDRADAKMSGPAIARAFFKMRDYFADLRKSQYCWRHLHLITHSMGNYAFRHALQAIIAESGGQPLPRLFQNIFLMAADEDNDAFEHDHKFGRLHELTEAVHVYYSSSDRALDISRVTKTHADRLGTTGPRTLSNLPLKISLVDCRFVDETELGAAAHQYYRSRPEITSDVREVLSGVPADLIPNRDYIPEKRTYRIRAYNRT
jgi:esterase/lipase superfamily enzyme